MDSLAKIWTSLLSVLQTHNEKMTKTTNIWLLIVTKNIWPSGLIIGFYDNDYEENYEDPIIPCTTKDGKKCQLPFIYQVKMFLKPVWVGKIHTWSRGLCHTFCKDMVVQE